MSIRKRFSQQALRAILSTFSVRESGMLTALSNLGMHGMSDTIRRPLGLRISGDLRFSCTLSFSLVAEISKPEFCTCELFGMRSNARKGSAIAPDRYDRRSLPCRWLVDREDGSAVLRKRLAFSLRARPRRYSAASAFCAVKRLLRNMIKLGSLFPNYIRLCFLAYAYYVRRWWKALFS